MQSYTYSAHKIRKIILSTLLLTATLCVAQPAYALIVGSTTPLNRSIAVNRTTSVIIPWKVVTTAAGPVTSSQAAFTTPAGTILKLVNTPLNGPSFIHAGEAFPSFQATESLLIPASVVAKARAAGASQIRYSRLFLDFNTNPPGAPVIFIINITGSAGAGFSISREALSFTDK